MHSYSQRPRNRQRSRDPLERRMDQWLETGRQFVDGVSGNRPGQRRGVNPFGSNLDDVGRWVGDKLDWFFEEEDDWIDSSPLEKKHSTMNFSSRKRPLQAISRRGTKSISPSDHAETISFKEDKWPDESFHRLESQTNIDRDLEDSISSSKIDPDFSRSVKKRRLPRSSRRRN